MARDLINTDINNMSELEFKTTIIRILAGLAKLRRHRRIPHYKDKRTKI